MNKYLTQPHPMAHLYTGGQSAAETRMSRALGVVADMAEYYSRGDVTLGAQARQTLDTLCWSPKGYPEPVLAALRAAGLRETAETECLDCGSTYHQTGTYHCPSVHQGDSAD